MQGDSSYWCSPFSFPATARVCSLVAFPERRSYDREWVLYCLYCCRSHLPFKSLKAMVGRGLLRVLGNLCLMSNRAMTCGKSREWNSLYWPSMLTLGDSVYCLKSHLCNYSNGQGRVEGSPLLKPLTLGLQVSEWAESLRGVPTIESHFQAPRRVQFWHFWKHIFIDF